MKLELSSWSIVRGLKQGILKWNVFKVRKHSEMNIWIFRKMHLANLFINYLENLNWNSTFQLNKVSNIVPREPCYIDINITLNNHLQFCHLLEFCIPLNELLVRQFEIAYILQLIIIERNFHSTHELKFFSSSIIQLFSIIKIIKYDWYEKWYLIL